MTRERHDVITPYAFEVHPALLGLPLAEPWRRFVAIGMDGLVVGLLALVPNGALALATGVAVLHSMRRPPHPWLVRRRRWLRALALALIAGGIVSLWSGVMVEGDDSTAAPPVVPPPTGASLTLELGAGAERAGEATHSVIAWARGLLDDLGIGLGWAALYFTVFPAWWNGQTPGKKLLGLRVVQLDATPITLWEAFERYGGYGAGVATGLLGFIQVWWDPNRQAIHDKIAETVVIRGNVPTPTPMAPGKS